MLGLKKVTQVRKGLAVELNGTHFTQEIKWEEVVSKHQTIANYSIRYKQAENNSTGSIQTSQVAMANLILPLPTSPTTYNVWVAAVGEETGVGEYSQVLKLTYSGKCVYEYIQCYYPSNVSKCERKQCILYICALSIDATATACHCMSTT